MNRYNIGIDIGSTTLKAVMVATDSGRVVLDIYQRHQAKVMECLRDCLQTIQEKFGYRSLGISGSVHGGAVWYDMLLEF